MELKKIKAKNKKAALELSIGTIVILVIAMSMLILGLILVRTIFKSATGTVKQLDDGVRQEIQGVFNTDEDKDIVVLLGSGNKIEIPADGKTHNVAFGAGTLDGSKADIDKMKYKLTLSTDERENCITELNERKVEEFVMQNLDTWLKFDETQDDLAYALVEINVPKGTQLCSQKIRIAVEEDRESVGHTYFKFDVVKKGWFG